MTGARRSTPPPPRAPAPEHVEHNGSLARVRRHVHRVGVRLAPDRIYHRPVLAQDAVHEDERRDLREVRHVGQQRLDAHGAVRLEASLDAVHGDDLPERLCRDIRDVDVQAVVCARPPPPSQLRNHARMTPTHMCHTSRGRSRHQTKSRTAPRYRRTGARSYRRRSSSWESSRLPPASENPSLAEAQNWSPHAGGRGGHRESSSAPAQVMHATPSHRPLSDRASVSAATHRRRRTQRGRREHR